MSVTNLGDLSHSYALRLRNVSLRQDIQRLTQELASGQVADVNEVLAGNHNYLMDIERRSSILQGFSVATTEATIYASTMQDALAQIQTHSAGLSSSMLTAGSSAIGPSGTATASEARAALDGIIQSLNTSAAGRHLFSGTHSDQPPLPGADAVLTALQAAVAGASNPDDLLSAAETWFNDPGGFEATLYQGSTDAIAPFELSQNDRVTLDVRAIDPKLKDILRLTAVAALADNPTFGFDLEAQSELFDKAGQSLLMAQDNLIALRADVGFVEGRIDQINARNAAELTSMSYAKAALLEVDPFESATRLEEAQFQLQSLYSVTVRMSQLSLVNFL